MARSKISTDNYNYLYNGMRSVASSRGISYNVKTFFDGSGVVNITVSSQGATVTRSVIVCALYSDGEIIGYRASNEDKMQTFEKIQECVQFCKNIVTQTRMILSKI